MLVWLFVFGLLLFMAALCIGSRKFERSESVEKDVDDMVLCDMQQYDDEDMIGEAEYYD